MLARRFALSLYPLHMLQVRSFLEWISAFVSFRFVWTLREGLIGAASIVCYHLLLYSQSSCY